MIKRIIGLILILVILFFTVKAITYLPFFTDLIIGSNKSPFQVGTDYVNQINNIYPYNKNKTVYNVNQNTNIVKKVTLNKIDGKLVLFVENANPKTNLNIWLTNKVSITDQTEYIDFGILYKDNSIRKYVVDMKGGDISLQEFNNVLIVDKNNNIYERFVLN